MQSHNSVVGIREYALRFGGGFRSVDEEEVTSLNGEQEVVFEWEGRSVEGGFAG